MGAGGSSCVIDVDVTVDGEPLLRDVDASFDDETGLALPAVPMLLPPSLSFSLKPADAGAGAGGSAIEDV
jgi:hypothetical protein